MEDGSLASSESNLDEPHEGDVWETSNLQSQPYVSSVVKEMDAPTLAQFIESVKERTNTKEGFTGKSREADILWEQVKLEAEYALQSEPQAGPQLYQAILSQPTFLDAIMHVVTNDIATPLFPATVMTNLFRSTLTKEDDWKIHLDVMAAAMRSPSVESAMVAILFNKGLQVLVCHRVSHRLMETGRRGLAYYMQSTMSARYSADIHPSAQIGGGVFLNCGKGVVIGETAVVGDDVTILQGVTLGGTGKENGDRHPKIGKGVILHDGATVLGNIKVGKGAIICAKSIVTKEVPPLAKVSGVPAKIKNYRKDDIADGFFHNADNLADRIHMEDELKKHLDKLDTVNTFKNVRPLYF